MGELRRIKDAIRPSDTLLVVDAMVGQEAANLVKAYNYQVHVGAGFMWGHATTRCTWGQGACGGRVLRRAVLSSPKPWTLGPGPHSSPKPWTLGPP